MTVEQIKKALTTIAGIITAGGVIVGATITFDNRYVKPSDLKAVKVDILTQMDKMHQTILENEQLHIQLGDSVKATKLLLERNKQELADIKARLALQQHQQRLMLKALPSQKLATPDIIAEEPAVTE